MSKKGIGEKKAGRGSVCRTAGLLIAALLACEAGKLLGLPLVDHIIIGAEGRFLSLAEMGTLNNRFEVA